METRTCTKCARQFEPDARIDERLSKLGPGHFHRVCPSCALASIFDAAAESVEHMTDEEIEAELREDGVDVEAFSSRMRDLLAKARP